MAWDGEYQIESELYKIIIAVVNWNGGPVWNDMVVHRCWNSGILRRELGRILDIDPERTRCLGVTGEEPIIDEDPIDECWKHNCCTFDIRKEFYTIDDDQQPNYVEILTQPEKKVYKFTDGSRYNTIGIDNLQNQESVKLMLQLRGFLPDANNEDIVLMQEGRIFNIRTDDKFWDVFRSNAKNINVQCKLKGGGRFFEARKISQDQWRHKHPTRFLEDLQDCKKVSTMNYENVTRSDEGPPSDFYDSYMWPEKRLVNLRNDLEWINRLPNWGLFNEFQINCQLGLYEQLFMRYKLYEGEVGDIRTLNQSNTQMWYWFWAHTITPTPFKVKKIYNWVGKEFQKDFNEGN
jgi:hypothetical protein